MMKSLWNESEATRFATDLVEMRAYSSRLLGQNEDLVLHGGGNTSVKVSEQNIFGQSEEILYIKGSGHDLKTIQRNGFAPTRLSHLKKLATLERLSDSEMMKQLKVALTEPSAPTPSVEALVHALIPFAFVDHSHADAVVAISNSTHGERIIREIYNERILVLPYIMPGFILARQIYEATLDLDWKKCEGIILLHHGVITFGADAKTSYENMIDICGRAEDYLQSKNIFAHCAQKKASPLQPLEIARLRKEVSEMAGRPFVASLDRRDEAVGYASLPQIATFGAEGPITPDHVLHTKRIPMILDGSTEGAVQRYGEDYRLYFERHRRSEHQCLDAAPRFAVWKDQGILHFAPNPKRLRIVEDLVSHTLKAVQWGEALGGWKALNEKDIFDLEYWELEQAKLKSSAESKLSFEGKVAVVTGAASGIGKAIAEAFLKQGAAVVGLDIQASPLSLTCDITKTEDIRAALHETLRRYGGIDVLVSNAGSFPQSVSIEKTEDSFWEKTVDLNLNSHMKVMREAIPFLKLGLEPSIIIVGSKNVAAPGAGVAAYSASKAALTQLGRVAAFELGKEGIRVNMIHPNAVFDTGIWDKETIQKRATAYGLTVSDYKQNNILHCEITSHDVAALVLQMAGKSFSKTTGAQVPIDGGNERVI